MFEKIQSKKSDSSQEDLDRKETVEDYGIEYEFVLEFLEEEVEEQASVPESDVEYWREHWSEHEKTKAQEKRIGILTRQGAEMRDLLATYGIRSSAVEHVSGDVYRLKLSGTEFGDDIDKLPDGYGYEGGVARALLRRGLGINPQAGFRDVDIVKVDESAGSQKQDRELAETYMPDDYRQGYGVEPLDDGYFGTRDFTVNEIYAEKDTVYLTRACLLDTARRIIRISEYEKREPYYSEDPFYTDDKLLAKAVRLVAQSIVEHQQLSLADGEIYETQDINAFHIALHLDRALGKGKEVAEEYVRILQEKGQLPEDIDTPEKAAAFTREEMRGSFVFRHAPVEMYDAEDEWLAKMEEQHADLIAEYE